MRLSISLLALLLVPCVATAQVTQQLATPSHGFAPDSATAVRIAVAVWIPLYGEQAVMAKQPFIARLQDGVWTVTTSPSSQASSLIILNGAAGSVVLVAAIAQRDARILHVSQDW